MFCCTALGTDDRHGIRLWIILPIGGNWCSWICPGMGSRVRSRWTVGVFLSRSVTNSPPSSTRRGWIGRTSPVIRSVGGLALEAGVLGMARSVTALSPAGFWRRDAGFGYTRRLFGTVERLSRTFGTRAPRLVRSTAGRALLFGWIVAHPSRIDPELALGDVYAFRRAIPAMRSVVREATRFTGVVPMTVPVTIAWAARDYVFPAYQARRARTVLPTAHHVRLRGCGHVPMSDDPALVADVLLRGSTA